MEEDERSTRRVRVDPKLVDAGWPLSQVGRHDLPVAQVEYPTANGPADYVLSTDRGPVAVVEVKRLALGPQNVLTQAERYSRGLGDSPFDFGGYGAPFLYSTNGEIIWFRDVRHRLNRSRRVSAFHTPAALHEQLDRDLDAALRRLDAMPVDNPRLRPYQRDAIKAIENGITERKRQLLVAMATGTGKTFMVVNEVYRLMKAGVARRILFLVDRKALAAQAVRAFSSFEAEPGLKFDQIYELYSQRFQPDDGEELFDPKHLPNSYLTDPNPGLAFVYVCTIQRMAMNLFGRRAVLEGEEPEEEDVEALNIPIHAFDLVIADECHRGYTAAENSLWRSTLDHFDSTKLGLTATPAAHTSAYFNDLAYRYEYERAVREGYLVDYDVVEVTSDVRVRGMFLAPGEQVGLVDGAGVERLDFLEDERQFDSTEIERKVTSPDSSRKVLTAIKTFAEAHEQEHGRFPKTLIFAVNDLPHTSHADSLVDMARDVFGRGDHFVQKITGRVDRPLQRIREFRNRPNPGIAVTVDLLSTGIDIPDLEFIVLLRTIKSRILFEQILGRGTRRGERFQDKSHFTVFDCFGGSLIDYFRTVTTITAEMPTRPTTTVDQLIDDIWANRDREYSANVLAKRLLRIDKEMSGDARELFAAHVSEGDVAGFARRLQHSLASDFTGTMRLLRDDSFRRLLVHYPRRPRSFLIAYDSEDAVSSEWLIKAADGVEYRPGDYLLAFEDFIGSHRTEVAAIQILLDRPGQWSATSLTDLRSALLAAPQRFTLANLQAAHQVRYGKALVDIISMVKHAARNSEPLLTSEERVTGALTRLTAGRSLSADQLQWLDRIQAHLVENLSIEKQDFDDLPVFSRVGGWPRANKSFDNDLARLLTELNEAVAA